MLSKPLSVFSLEKSIQIETIVQLQSSNLSATLMSLAEEAKKNEEKAKKKQIDLNALLKQAKADGGKAEDKSKQAEEFEELIKEPIQTQQTMMDKIETKLKGMKSKLATSLEDLKPKSEKVDIKDVKCMNDLKVEKELGAGAFGTVSLVVHASKNYALKVIDRIKIIRLLKGDRAGYDKMRDREVAMSKAVFNLKFCTKFYAHFEHANKDCYVYEFCNGGDLTGLRTKQPNGRFTEVTMKKYIEQMAHAINALHNMKIVHRDIKPDNAFLVINNKGEIEIRLGDFGTARTINENNEFTLEVNESINTTTVGSGYFASPEMTREMPNGTPTDVWSFAITIGVLIGLDDVCPTGYRAGLPGFIRDCFAGKHNLWLHEQGIYISQILSPLMKNMLKVDQF